jgi:hypothetical protein
MSSDPLDITNRPSEYGDSSYALSARSIDREIWLNIHKNTMPSFRLGEPERHLVAISKMINSEPLGKGFVVRRMMCIKDDKWFRMTSFIGDEMFVPSYAYLAASGQIRVRFFEVSDKGSLRTTDDNEFLDIEVEKAKEKLLGFADFYDLNIAKTTSIYKPELKGVKKRRDKFNDKHGSW